MAAAASLLAAIDPEQPPPQSVRQAGVPPWRMATTRDAFLATLAEVTGEEAKREGHLAVIVPDTRVAELGVAVSGAVPGASSGESLDLTNPVVVLGARQAKGLEFDAVLIADPAAILAGSPRGRSGLYVAMTRSTQRLGVLHPGPPPADLAGLSARRPPGT
jgi:superfamily I DNA/RNA helicase